MKSFTFALLVTVYFVCTHINCDKDSGYLHKNFSDRFFKNLVNKSVRVEFENIFKDVDVEKSLASNEEKGRLCLKNITSCMQEDKAYEETSSKFTSFMFSSLPPFDLSSVSGVSQSCQQQSKKFLTDLKKFKYWALQMYDATAKIPSGVLNGNINQLGDFDICLDANSQEHDIQGQYCLASLEVQSPDSSYMSGLHRLIQSHMHFKSRLEDPGHRVPRFSSINWALCVPNACTANDVHLGLRHKIDEFLKGTDLNVRLEVDPNMCQTKASNSKIPISSYVAGSIFAAFILFILYATVYDNYTTEDKNQWIVAFSLIKNCNSLKSTRRPGDDIEAVHGVRMLNALLLLLAHKSMALFFVPFVNRTEYVEYVAKPWTVLGRAASLYTDPFIMLSGTLTAYSMLGRLQKTGSINIAQEYISRILRILPTFAALIAFCTFILPWLNSGPMWNLVVTHHSDICKQNWWRNLLFIHNYFGFKDMCLTHTHHIGIDTQLFFLSPVLVYIIWKWPRRGTLTLLGLATISTIARYHVTVTMRLSNYIHFGTSIQQLFDTADNMYILPAHRLTVYIMGVLLGYILRNYRTLTLTDTQIKLGNAVALFSFLTSFLGAAFMGSIDYKYDPVDAAWYAAFAPIFWCLSFAWVIFTTHLGYSSSLGRIFSHRICFLWTKISYTVYLTQFPAYFFNVGVGRNPESYGFFRHMFNFKEYLWVIVLSSILTLTFEMPFQNIRNLVFNKKSKSSCDVPQEKKIS